MDEMTKIDALVVTLIP